MRNRNKRNRETERRSSDKKVSGKVDQIQETHEKEQEKGAADVRRRKGRVGDFDYKLTG